MTLTTAKKLAASTGAWIEFERRADCWFCDRKKICRKTRYVDSEDKFLQGRDMCEACSHRFLNYTIKEWEPICETDKEDIEPEELEVMRMVTACGFLNRKLLRDCIKLARSA